MTVPPEEILRQLREHLDILRAPMPLQRRWTEQQHKYGVPIDELMLSFFDMFPGFIPRLREAGLVPPAAEAALRRLEQHFESMRVATKIGDPLWVDWDQVATAAEWQQVRELASEALALLPSRAAP